MQVTEHSLELSIMELFENEGYTHQTGVYLIKISVDVYLLSAQRASSLRPKRYALKIIRMRFFGNFFYALPEKKLVSILSWRTVLARNHEFEVQEQDFKETRPKILSEFSTKSH